MPEVVSFNGYTPPARFDSIPWTDAQIEEAATSDGTWTVIDTVSLGTPDPDPANPASRSFTTSLGTGPDLWYRVSFVDGSLNVSEPTSPVQNTGAPAPYATVEQIAPLLNIRNPTDEQIAGMERVLLAAAYEINDEIDNRTDLSPGQLALVEEVNIERAVEHWQQGKSPFGIFGLGPELGAERVARDSWDRHARKLEKLKESWGFA